MQRACGRNSWPVGGTRWLSGRGGGGHGQRGGKDRVKGVLVNPVPTNRTLDSSPRTEIQNL